jgi:hypothetical protein
MEQFMTTRKTTRRAVLAGGAAAIPTTAMALPIVDRPDPIFAAINRHKLAHDAMEEALAAAGTAVRS